MLSWGRWILRMGGVALPAGRPVEPVSSWAVIGPSPGQACGSDVALRRPRSQYLDATRYEGVGWCRGDVRLRLGEARAWAGPELDPYWAVRRDGRGRVCCAHPVARCPI
eukprot:4451693-Amphidinium_carterae.2